MSCRVKTLRRHDPLRLGELAVNSPAFGSHPRGRKVLFRRRPQVFCSKASPTVRSSRMRRDIISARRNRCSAISRRCAKSVSTSCAFIMPRHVVSRSMRRRWRSRPDHAAVGQARRVSRREKTRAMKYASVGARSPWRTCRSSRNLWLSGRQRNSDRRWCAGSACGG